MGTTPAMTAVRSATIRAVILVLIGSVGVQMSSVLAYGLFTDVGPLGTSSLRMLFAAVLLLVIFRPKLRGKTTGDWLGIVVYGFSMAASNVLLYLAIDLIPLGIATTLDFLGPCMVALVMSRRIREGLLALLAFGGVALIAGLGGPLNPLGLLFGLLAGAAFALYTVFAPVIGKSGAGLQNMALAVAVSAVLTMPMSLPALPRVEVTHLLPLIGSAVLGTMLAFTVDTMAGKLTSARVIGVLFAFDPMIGTLIGALLLGQTLTIPALLGVALVIIAGAGIVWFAGQDRQEPTVLPIQEEANTVNGAHVSVEVERKYEVEDAQVLPGAAELAQIGLTLGDQELIHLEARYFDTPDGSLAGTRCALRVRRGGSDQGWHLKEKGEDGVREFQWPLSHEMPPGVIAELTERLGAAAAAQVAPIATLLTIRTTLTLHNAAGEAVIEIADDLVDASNELTGNQQRWREWEAELLPAAGASEQGAELLDALEPLLISAGANRVRGTSKIQRTMS